MKNFKKWILCIFTILICSTVFLSGCSLFGSTVSITKIEKTSTLGLVDTYTIYYSDGTTSTFEITNGRDSDAAGVGIRYIAKTSSVGLVDTYTIYYSNGTTSTYTVTNGADGIDGKDGEDGEDAFIADAYEQYKLIYGENLTYDEFLQKYIGSASSDNVKSIHQSLLSAVTIHTEFIETDGQKLYIGSGVIYQIDSDYTYIITNCHVVYSASSDVSVNGGYYARNIFVYLYGSEDTPVATASTDSTRYPVLDGGDYAIEAELVGASISQDLALIKVETNDLKDINEDVKEIEFADEYYIGEDVYAIGNTGGLGIEITKGVISQEIDIISLKLDSTERKYRCLRMDTSIYSGNSGGGVFNKDGELVGIANAGNNNIDFINYALPLDNVRNYVENIMYNYELQDYNAIYGYSYLNLGVDYIEVNAKYQVDAEGYGKCCSEIYINSSVSSGTFAKAVGLQKGDIITSIIVNDIEYIIENIYELESLLIKVKIGDKVVVKYIRNAVDKESSIVSISSSYMDAND